MQQPKVTKEYYEDLIVVDDELDEEYRWWEYRFDFGNHTYRVRLYTDEPEVAYTVLVREDLWARLNRLRRRASHDPSLRAIYRHLRTDTGRPVDIHVLTRTAWGPPYRRVPLD